MVEGANKKAEDMHKAFANANAKQGGEGKSRRKHSQPVRFSDKLEQRREQQWRKNQSALRRKLGFQIDEEKRLVMQPLSEIGGGKGSSVGEVRARFAATTSPRESTQARTSQPPDSMHNGGSPRRSACLDGTT